ncbi:MAG: S9 family peptidase [Deltaproteobacteria bacterium]|nr:S9 family peptidase [Deltaproteobacteria bacterium]
MTKPAIRPYGSWKSPISADLVASQALGFTDVKIDNGHIYWIESRPSEKGRCVIVQRSPEGSVRDITPSPYNARTRMHEYGGGSFAVAERTVIFSHFSDQRLYRQDPGADPLPITPEASKRYADAVFDRRRGRIICACETHSANASEPVNTLAAVKLAGSAECETLVSGNDFYASPRLSPDGSRLAWLTWNHPNMPWDGTELWVAEVNEDGTLSRAEKVAGGVEESIFQPEWSPDGMLYFISDRSGWWNLYSLRNNRIQPVTQQEAEFGVPQWVFGMSTYAFESAGRIVCAYTRQGRWHLACLCPLTGNFETIETPFTELGFLRAASGSAVFIAGSHRDPLAVVRLDLVSRTCEVIRSSGKITIAPEYLSSPEAIEFPTSNDRKAYAFFYPPQNRDYVAPSQEKPPLLVMSHGGPTASASTTLNLRIQYWTSRGFAVLDVNYRGSAGYGRAYRRQLNGQWGVVDVDDCVNGARYLLRRGDVDSNRLAVRGSSAGGFTTLCALTFHNLFKAGASYYGISDLESLVTGTHKFELHYLDRLIGPYPECVDRYRDRSPITHVDRLSCPLIVFQGLDDPVVLPNQAEMIVTSLRGKGVPVAYLPFPGEQHGFRSAETIKRSLEAELYFYATIFDITLADPVAPVPIDNL